MLCPVFFTKPNFASSARRVRLAPKSTLHVTSLVVSFGPRPNTSYVHSVRLPVVSFGPRPNSSEPAALRTVLASPLPVAPPSLVAPAHHLLPCFIERDLSARRPRLTLSGLLLASLSPLPPDPAHLGVIGSARAGAVWAQREAHSRLRTGSQFVDYNADPRFVAYLWLTRNKCW